MMMMEGSFYVSKLCAAMRLIRYLPAHFEREIKIDGLDCGTILERRKCIEREKEKGEKEVKNVVRFLIFF